MNRNPYNHESMVESRGEIGHGLVWGAKFGGLKWHAWLLLPGETPCHHCALTVLFKWYLRSEVLPNVHITSRAPSRLRSLPCSRHTWPTVWTPARFTWSPFQRRSYSLPPQSVNKCRSSCPLSPLKHGTVFQE